MTLHFSQNSREVRDEYRDGIHKRYAIMPGVSGYTVPIKKSVLLENILKAGCSNPSPQSQHLGSWVREKVGVGQKRERGRETFDCYQLLSKSAPE